MNVLMQVVPAVVVMAALVGCGEESKADKPVQVGDSCEGMKTSAAYACQGSLVLFCSALTGNKFQVQDTCPSGKSCVLAADKQSTRCE